jgi:hypothetical protein
MTDIDVIAKAKEFGADTYHVAFTPEQLRAYTDHIYNLAQDDLRKESAKEEPVAWMFPDDLLKFQESETFAQAYSVKVGSPNGLTEPLYTHPSPDTIAQAVAEQKEKDARICDDNASIPFEGKSEYDQGYDSGCYDCAEAIRSS